MSSVESPSIHATTPVAPVKTTPVVCEDCTPITLLTWKKPAKTGKIFGGIIVSLIVLKTVNLFNVFFHLAYIGLLLSAAVEYAGKLVTGEGFITKYKPSANTIAKQINNDVLPLVAKFNLRLEKEFQDIVYAHDIETTLKAAGISYVLFKVTSWFSFFTLFTTTVVLAFTVPAIYVRNKEHIDALVAEYSACAKSKFANVTKLAQEKATPIVQNLIEKSGPVGNFITSKFPVRTAGSTVGQSKSTFGTKADQHAAPVSTTPVTHSSAHVAVPSATTSGASKFPDVHTVKSSIIDEEFKDTEF